MRRGPRPGSSGRLYLPSEDINENMRLQREAEEGRQLEVERKEASWYAAEAAAEAAAAVAAEKERKEEIRKKSKNKRKKQTGGKKRRKKRKKTRKKHKHKTRRGGNKKAKKYWGMSITKRWKKNPLSFIFPKTNWWYQTAKFGIPL
jgi:hypothetical protein